MRGFNYRKAVQSLAFFSKMEGGETNKMKAIKLIWLADRLHLRKYGRTITGDVYFALKHGPVPSTTRDILELNSFSLDVDELQYSDEFIKIVDKYNYSSLREVDNEILSESELEVLQAVYKFYGKFDHWELRNLSHYFPEWKKHEDGLNKGISSRFAMSFVDFFEDSPLEYDFLPLEKDITNYSKELFLQGNEIISFL